MSSGVDISHNPNVFDDERINDPIFNYRDFSSPGKTFCWNSSNSEIDGTLVSGDFLSSGEEAINPPPEFAKQF